MNSNRKEMDAETKAYLDKIARTVAESKAIISQVELRMAETDRMLASQGLTREDVQTMTFTPEQLNAVNRELKRRGMAPLDAEEILNRQEDTQVAGDGAAAESRQATETPEENLGNRQKKFSMMMNKLRL